MWGSTSIGRRLRRLTAAGSAIVCLAALTGCFGPLVRTGIDVTMSCRIGTVAGTTPLPDQTFHIELTAPEWSDPGEEIPLNGLTITGGTPNPEATAVWASVDLEGLTGFRQLPDAPFDNTFFGGSPAGDEPVTFPDAAVTVDDDPGSYATVRLDYVAWWAPAGNRTATCVPKDGQPTRLALIEVGPGGPRG